MDYSIVIPIYGDAYLAEKCVERLYKAFAELVQKSLPNKKFHDSVEIILIVDGLQKDFDLLHDLPYKWSAVKILFLSRNFGQHNAISAGYEHATGKYIIRLNVDCQEPPEQIPALIQELQNSDADQAIGIYKNKAAPFLNRITSDAFYSFFNWLSGYKTPLNTSPLRVMTHKYMEVYNSLSERDRFPQGLDEYLGFKKIYVPIEHNSREDKKSSYNFTKRLNLAISAAVSFSDRPMHLIIKTGFLIFIMGIGFSAFNIYIYFFIDRPVSGYTTVVLLLTIFSSSIFMAIGVLGLYIGDVQREVKLRPYYLVKSKVNFNG